MGHPPRAVQAKSRQVLCEPRIGLVRTGAACLQVSGGRGRVDPACWPCPRCLLCIGGNAAGKYLL